jgi:pimeloyl-ACP methyl ester carboxylesterase
VRAILLHGFNVSDEGDRTIGRLQPYLDQAGLHVKRPRYGWLGLLGVRLLNRRFARLIADLAEPGDIVIAHSNGCAIAAEAADLGAPFGEMVLINPALDSDRQFPRQVGRVHVWHSPSDAPVWASKFIPWHSWGDMGAVGYRGPYDYRVTSYNKENAYPVSSSSHSDVFDHGKIEFFAPLILSALELKP